MVLSVFQLMPPQLVINRIKWWKMSFFQENLMEPSGGPSGSISTRLQKTTPIQVLLVLCPNQGRTARLAGSWAPFASAPTSTRRGRGDKHTRRRKLTFIRHSHKTLRIEVKLLILVTIRDLKGHTQNPGMHQRDSTFYSRLHTFIAS